ncbi:hypothetical protein EJ08DRAFT_649337 [Tothia fuscella]|uniref:Uncharacterized protein n=1 Tax=Tothia fuscella TaxID=1048955 RepID=A0A9P4NSU5_9PEZI|nr:hypothetical protein EJ08DRAFT_649337 [Tothia fuscella]
MPTTRRVVSSARRERTPPAQLPTDEDLYGLSPDGEASRLRMESRRQSTQLPPQSALKAQGTPAIENSVLALAKFKRRPRQPSIIRMVQQTSELGNQSDFDATLDDTLRDFDEFNPDDESTPLYLNKRRSDGASASKNQRDSLIHTSSSRKRKSLHEEEIQVPRSPSLASSPPPNPARSISDARSTSSSSLPERVIPSTEQEERQNREAERYSDTMAPPRSSSEFSSPPSKPIEASTHSDKRRKTTTKSQNATKDPAPTKQKGTTRSKAPTISTAALKSLLPKAPLRKCNAAKVDTYDIPSSDPVDTILSDSDDDGDELAKTSSPRRRATITITRTPIRPIHGNKGMKKKKATTTTTTTSNARKSLKPATVAHKRTYGRAKAAESEKENDDSHVISDDENDSSIEEIGARTKKQRDSGVDMADTSKELVEARKKFEEVDEWEMEFESVDLGGGASSSPYR